MPKKRLRRARGRGRLVWIVLGTLVAVGGAIGLGMSVPKWEARADYVHAAACTDAVSPDCLLPGTAFVTGKRVGGGRMHEYQIRLDVQADEIELPDPEPVYAALREGRQVHVWYWRGHIVRVGLPGVGEAETEHSPRVEAVEYTLMGLAALTWGAFGAWHGYGMGRRRDDLDPTGRVLLSGVVGSAVVFFQVLSFDVYDPVVPWLTFAAVTLAVWAAVSMRRRPSDDFGRS